MFTKWIEKYSLFFKRKLLLIIITFNEKLIRILLASLSKNIDIITTVEYSNFH